jgi:hypothetical protein
MRGIIDIIRSPAAIANCDEMRTQRKYPSGKGLRVILGRRDRSGPRRIPRREQLEKGDCVRVFNRLPRPRVVAPMI